MRNTLLLVAALLCAAGVSAKPRSFNPVAEAIAAIAAERGTSDLGSMTVADLESAVARLTVAMRQEAWIDGSAMASLALPGLGQFLNRDPLGGSLYLAGSAAVAAGALGGAWLLLPLDVRTGWFSTPIGDLRTDFASHAFADYLPSLGVIAAGVALDAVLRWCSAAGAARLAERRVRDGTIAFEPVLITSGTGFGFGVTFRPRP